MTFPTAEGEAKDPQRADNVYETATDQLRMTTRKKKDEFPLVFEENCHYGYRRNVLGLRPWAIAICLATALALGALLILDSTFVRSERGVLAALAAMDLVAAAAWWRLVTPEWVKQPAFAYAQRLLEETWALGPTASGRTGPNEQTH